MNSDIKKISDTFSSGDFAAVYPSMAEDIVWNVVGSNLVKGKQAVIDSCTKMLEQMEGSVLVNTVHIVSDTHAAVQGYCNYKNEDGTDGRVEYCDVYRFNGSLLSEITSYCFEIKAPAK